MRAQRWEAHGHHRHRRCRSQSADLKHVLRADAAKVPLAIGYEVPGTIAALGPDTSIASGAGSVGDPVIAFRVRGGYATAITVPATDVFIAPTGAPPEQAVNLLLAGCTAAEMLQVCGAVHGDTVLLHGASGAVGVAVLQLSRRNGIRVIGTTSDVNAGTVARFGGIRCVTARDCWTGCSPTDRSTPRSMPREPTRPSTCRWPSSPIATVS